MIIYGGASVVVACGELFGIPELTLCLGTAVLEAEIPALDSVAWAYESAEVHH